MDTGLGGKRVLVTGASGGIGSACARAFAAEGARVFLHYNTGRERVQSVAEELGGAPCFGADLTREDEVDALFERVVEELGGLDVCAAVAGSWPEEDVPAWRLPLDRWEDTVRGNLTVTFLTARAFLRTFPARASLARRPGALDLDPSGAVLPSADLAHR